MKKIINPITKYNFHEVKDQIEWEKCLNSFNVRNFYNSWGWGEYKKKQRWLVQRFIIVDNNGKNKIGLFQLQTKIKFILKITLIQSGLHIDGDETICTNVMQELSDMYCKNKYRDLIFINYFTEQNEKYFRSLLNNKYSPLLNGSMYSFIVDTKESIFQLLSSLSRNWRHNLKRAQKNESLCVRWAISEEDKLSSLKRFEEMYSNLGFRKGFSLPVNINQMTDIIVNDSNYLICEAIYKNEVIAIRIAYKNDNYLSDFLAASNDLAKNNYANYLLVWSFINICKELELDFFECGGIDPAGNSGVYNFKKGLGGKLITMGPLWVFSRSKLLNFLSRIAFTGN